MMDNEIMQNAPCLRACKYLQSCSCAIVLVLGLSSCASSTPCEDILEVKRQEKVCAELSQTMMSKTHPQQALTARKRFDEECRDLRYYRDDYDTICKGDAAPIGERQ